jgi:hypothetical protein
MQTIPKLLSSSFENLALPPSARVDVFGRYERIDAVDDAR